MRDFIILLLRLALGIAFLSAVADRFGIWGPPDSALTSWGNWENFVAYTGSLTFGATATLLNLLAWLTTILEFVLGLFLILGLKVRITALLSGFLLLLFGIGMAFNSHIKYALDYSVFSACFGAFLLHLQASDSFSLDYFLKQKSA